MVGPAPLLTKYWMTFSKDSPLSLLAILLMNPAVRWERPLLTMPQVGRGMAPRHSCANNIRSKENDKLKDSGWLVHWDCLPSYHWMGSLFKDTH